MKICKLIISRKLLYFEPDVLVPTASRIARPPVALPQAIAGRASRCCFRPFVRWESLSNF